MFNKDRALEVMTKFKEVIPWCCFIPFSLRYPPQGHPKSPQDKAAMPLVNFQDEEEQNIWYNMPVEYLIDLRIHKVFKCMGFFTGEKAGITMVDIDSKLAREPLEKFCGKTIEEMCGFILDTVKGYHLIFSYTPNIETQHAPRMTILHRPEVAIDIKNGGYFGLSTGVPGYNGRDYEIHGKLEDIHLKPFPIRIIQYINYLEETYKRTGDGIKWGNRTEETLNRYKQKILNDDMNWY